jgi:hypothetical protein
VPLRPLLVLALLAMFPPALLAQDPGAPARIARAQAALAPLAGLVGFWEGPATAVVGQGRTREFVQTEDVQWAASGTVITVRGIGRSTEPETRGQIQHDAVAIIWLDDETGKLRFRTHREGRSLEMDLEVKADTIIWGFAVPGGRVRFTTAFGNGVWHELGHFLREGAPPVQTMELRLRRRDP